MPKKQKKRNKKYRPRDQGPTVHTYTAEELEQASSKKRRKKWLIIAAIAGALILLILELIF